MTALAAGCGRGPVLAPVDRPASAPPPSRPPAEHVVRKGDTLYAIAWRYGLDYRDVARWNSIHPPYVIYPGQSVRLRPGASGGDLVAKQPSAEGGAPNTPRRPASSRTARAAVERPERRGPPPAGAPLGGGWHWPAEGRILQRFGERGNRGLDIEGRRGQVIKAAADGRVVYSGSGLSGYGKLIIIKHDKHFLTAYAHNDQVLVVEGEGVKGGDAVARMGDTGTDQVKLHFEVRRDGEPVDPIRYLPERRADRR